MKSRGTIVALGWEPWQSPPQCSLAELLAVLSCDARIVWVNPQPEWSELTMGEYLRRLRRGFRLEATQHGILVVDPPPAPPLGARLLPRPLRHAWTRVAIGCAKLIYACALRRFLERSDLAPDLSIVTEPFDLWLAGRMGEAETIYYVFDEVALMPGLEPFRAVIEEVERKGLRRVGVVFTSSLSQRQRRLGRHPRVVPLLNAISADAFIACGPEPEDLSFIPHPRLIVTGQVDFRIDGALIEELAHLRPDWSIIFVGPVRASGERTCRRLSALPNVRFLGHRDPAQLPAYQAASDAGLIPFVRGEATQAMRPLRLLSYLASGLAVVSAPSPELEPFAGHVQAAEGAAGFVDAIERALHEDSSNARAARRARALAETWESRARLFWETLDACRFVKGVGVPVTQHLEADELHDHHTGARIVRGA